MNMVVYVICRMGFIISDGERDVNQSVSETCFLMIRTPMIYPEGHVRIIIPVRGSAVRNDPQVVINSPGYAFWDASSGKHVFRYALAGKGEDMLVFYQI